MRFSLALLLPALLLAGCDGGADPQTDDLAVRPILENVSTDVILATYSDLAAEAAALESAAEALRTTPSEATLAAARAQWRAARQPWEQSEGFLLGPVDTGGFDPRIDSWPTDETSVQALLDSDAPITEASVRALDETLKGFHGIEYLLFGTDGARPASSFTERELDYLVAACAVLAGDTADLAAAWAPAGGNYAAQLARAGEAGSVYASQRAGMEELVTAVGIIADEVGSGKMGGPLGDGSTREVESRFSDNSLADFENNVRSVRHLYTGDYAGATGAGVGDFVLERDAALDARIRAEIETAITAIRAIPGPFRTAITEHPATVQTAIDAVLALRDTFDGPVAALVNG